jgi:hypothetical protein
VGYTTGGESHPALKIYSFISVIKAPLAAGVNNDLLME